MAPIAIIYARQQLLPRHDFCNSRITERFHMQENVTAEFVADEKSVAFGAIEPFYLCTGEVGRIVIDNVKWLLRPRSCRTI